MRILPTGMAVSLLLILGMCCKKSTELAVKDTTYINNLKGEARHTDSLIRIGKLKVGDPTYIGTRHPGDDATYDFYYERLPDGKPTKKYLLANKWTLTFVYDNPINPGTCWMWGLAHNGKSLYLQNVTREDFEKFKQWSQIEGTYLIKYLNY